MIDRLAVVVYDIIAIGVAWLGAYWLRDNMGHIDPERLVFAVQLLPIVGWIQLMAAWWFDLYRAVWRFTSVTDLARIIKSIGIGVTILILLLWFHGSLLHVPRSVFILYAMNLLVLWGGGRFLFRLINDNPRMQASGPGVLIVGAGAAGESLIRDMVRQNRYNLLGLVDDNQALQGKEIHRIRVIGPVTAIPALARQYTIELIFIAIPSATAAEMRRIVQYCTQAQIPFRTLPSLADLAHGRVRTDHLRQVAIEDLLGRPVVQFDQRRLKAVLQEKVVLITGAGGSVGSELSLQIAALNPKKLVLIDQSEFNLYQITQRLHRDYPHVKEMSYLADITDLETIMQIFAENQPKWVLHAAAYKHVPLLEYHMAAAIKNNVWGTYVCAQAAVANKVERFVLISTDKAVYPSSIMGASKRAAEKIVDYFDKQSGAKFMTVRFGNVFGSVGSVWPKFQEQLQAGGPITVTDPRMQRYFMTVTEAAHLIMKASLLGTGGEIFVLDMGEPVWIDDLVKQMIRLAGKEVGKDITITYTGLRPGEKLQEQLFYNDEKQLRTLEEKIFKAAHQPFDHQQTTQLLQALTIESLSDVLNWRQRLINFVPEYSPLSELSTTFGVG